MFLTYKSFSRLYSDDSGASFINLKTTVLLLLLEGGGYKSRSQVGPTALPSTSIAPICSNVLLFALERWEKPSLDHALVFLSVRKELSASDSGRSAVLVKQAAYSSPPRYVS